MKTVPAPIHPARPCAPYSSPPPLSSPSLATPRRSGRSLLSFSLSFSLYLSVPLSLSLTVSFAFARQSSTAETNPAAFSPPLEFRLCSARGRLTPSSRFERHDFYHPSPSSIYAMRPSFSFSRSPCLSLSLSNLFHLVPSSYPVSLFSTPSSSLLVSHSLLRKRLVSSSSRFPSLPSPHAAIAATAAATTHRRRAPLSGFARSSSSHPPPLFIFLRPSGLLVALSVHRTYTHTLRHSYMYTHEHCCSRVSPSRRLSSPVLLHPFSTPARVLLSLPLAARLPRVFSLTLARRILPSRRTEPPSRRDRLPPAIPSSLPSLLRPLFSYFSFLAEGGRRTGIGSTTVSLELAGICALMKSPFRSRIEKHLNIVYSPAPARPPALTLLPRKSTLCALSSTVLCYVIGVSIAAPAYRCTSLLDVSRVPPFA